MVAAIDTDLNPFELLDTCLAIEAGVGRERSVRWGARTLDIDVLLWGDATIESAELTVPHPRMWERRFVLQPLDDLAPHLLPADWDQRLPAGGVARVDDLEI
jgi:2-amino-4-hydroxy-6-hydroxymethyldihydropteridine diphosphokinase